MAVLIVDDNPVALKLLELTLHRQGRRTLIAKTGEEAWQVYLREQPAIVVTDWMMPDLDGPEFCRRVRAHPGPNYTYLILLTAKDRKENFVAGLDAGADDCISKPFNAEELDARLRVAERIASLQRRVRQYESLLPLCMYCKKIRDRDDQWVGVDEYLSEQTETSITHGCCPECLARQMHDLAQLRQQRPTG
jgi:DNA-binding response OmpR family regulator